MRQRISKLFALEGAAEAFMGSLPDDSKPLIIPNGHQFKVLYWDVLISKEPT